MRRLVAGVVAGDAVRVRHGLDASGLKDVLDVGSRAKDDRCARVGDDAGALRDDFAVDGDVAVDAPFASGGHGDQAAREVASDHSTIVQGAGAIRPERQAEAARCKRSLVTEALEEGRAVQRRAVNASIANETVVRERRRRCRIADVADGLISNGEVGAELRNDVGVDFARGLRVAVSSASATLS